jgi:hypothetical protein
MNLPPGPPPNFTDDGQAIRWLLDRAEIADTVSLYGVCLDTRDWALYRSILTDPIEMDYPETAGVGTFGLDELVGMASSFFDRLDATQHISANHQITIEGNEATCVSILHAQHYLTTKGEPPIERQIGYYTNYLRRLDRWRIWRSEQHISWRDGNPAIFEEMFHGSAVRRPPAGA